MAPKQRGLGSFGRNRVRENIGGSKSDTLAGHPLFGPDPEAEPEEVPTTTAWQYPDSSRISAYQYDYAAGQLRVRFHKYNTPWIYDGVPVSVFQAFDSSDSKGRYVNSTLNYTAYRRATPEEEINLFGD